MMEKKLAQIRPALWGILMICFFLPFAKGCENENIVPSQNAFKSIENFLIYGLAFLYPLLLALGRFIVERLSKEKEKKIFARAMYWLHFISLSILLGLFFRYCFDKRKTFDVLFLLGFTGIWGFAAAALPRLERSPLFMLISAQLSTLSFFWFLYHILTEGGAKILYGGWISLAASGLLVTTFLAKGMLGLTKL